MKYIKREYQELLKDLSLYDGLIDSLFGPKTEQAVKKFQAMNGLVVDGIIGKNTKAKFDEQLKKIPGRSSMNPRSPAPDFAPYTKWPKEGTNSLIRFYGGVGKNQKRIQIPYTMKLAWDKGVTLDSFVCHEKVAESMQGALEIIKDSYSLDEIEYHGFDLFGGCLNVRKIRGGNRWSTHSWGIAIDLDPARNGLNTSWKNSHFSHPDCKKFVDAWRSVGAYSLGLEKNYDSMHFQFCYR